MSILKKEFDNNRSMEDQDFMLSDSQIVMNFESALKSVDDMENVLNIYEAVLNTESPDVIAHYMNMMSCDEEVISTESAIKGKDGFLAKMKNLINNIAATQDEHMSWFEKTLANWGTKVVDLEKLRDDLKSGKYIVRDKVSWLHKGHANQLESNFGLIKAMGLDVNNVGNIAKLMTMPRVLADGSFEENCRIVELLQKNGTKDAEEFKKIIEDHKLPKATNSINFLKSLKGIDLKDVEIICGMVTKVFGKQTSLVTMYVENGKIKIDSDSLTFKAVGLKPQTSIPELIKLVETALVEFKSAKANMTKVNNSMKGVNKGLPNWVVPDTHAYSGIAALLSPTIRYRQNLVRAGINLQYDFWNIQWMTNAYVTYMVKKA